MDFNEAAVFVRVVQAGSFSAAAKHLGLPTSTVSTRVSRLEKRLGITLLQRTTRKLNLTEAGTAYYHHASLGLGYMLEAEAAIDEALQQPKGKLKVTAPADLGDALMGGMIVNIQREYPALEIELLFTDRFIDLVAEGVDVAIRAGELRDSTLMAKSLGTIRWALFATKSYLKQAAMLKEPHDLHAHQCLQFTPMGRDTWILRSGEKVVTVPLSGRTLANSIGVVRAMALNEQGVALLPTFICKPEVDHGDLVRVLPEWHGRADPVHLVYPRQRFMAPKLRAFLDHAQMELRRAFDE
jgi:DNA-binding transcriptional LysR family regulator